VSVKLIPESFIQDLLNRVDIVDVVDKSVPLKKAGANYSACCPFHNEKSPSFTVSPTKQFYHCFGCGAHGTAIGFVMEYQGMTFVESIHELAKMVGLTVPQEDKPSHGPSPKVVFGLQDALLQAAQFYKSELKKSPRAIEYLKARGLSGVIAAKYQIGYAPAGWQNLESVFSHYDDETLNIAGLVVQNEQGKRYDRFRDRIMFPIHDQKGQVIGFGGRVINSEDTPKYYNSPETPLFQKGHELYGLFAARRAIRAAGRALVVEGYMDVVALAQYEIEYAVASLGTATTPFHITKLLRQTNQITFCFDGDNAGRTAAWRAVQNTLPALTDELRLSFLFLPQGYDPDSYVREYGKEKFEAEIANAMTLSQYLIKQLCVNNPLLTQEDRIKLLNDAEPIMAAIKAPRSAMYLRKKIAELAKLSLDEMQSLTKLPNLNQAPKPFRPKLSRETLSIEKKYCLMLIMRPDLSDKKDLEWISGNEPIEELLRQTIEICTEHPNNKPVAIMRMLAGRIEDNIYKALQNELNQLDDAIDFESELLGARQQLNNTHLKHQESALLERISGKPLSSLTEDERTLLKTLGVKPSQN
jgi:DNA primase